MSGITDNSVSTIGMMTMQSNKDMTHGIVSSFVMHNTVAPDALPGLIRDVYATVSSLGAVPTEAELVVELKPAVPINKSITPDYLICLEDGARLKLLKRHLAQLGLTPAEYRAKWGLPDEYPMVAPNYAKQRSELAKGIGLGRKKAA